MLKIEPLPLFKAINEYRNPKLLTRSDLDRIVEAALSVFTRSPEQPDNLSLLEQYIRDHPWDNQMTMVMFDGCCVMSSLRTSEQPAQLLTEILTDEELKTLAAYTDSFKLYDDTNDEIKHDSSLLCTAATKILENIDRISELRKKL